MDSNFWFIIKNGINHVLDPNGYDHVLYVVLLALPYLFKNWKRVLLLVSLFTLGHTVSLVLAAYNIVSIDGEIIEFLIPVTILLTAVYNIVAFDKIKHQKINLLAISAVGFGLIHGFGFARYFLMLESLSESKLEVLLGFAIGIELAQVIIVLFVLFIATLCHNFFKISRRDWVIIISSIIIGLVIPMLTEADLLN